MNAAIKIEEINKAYGDVQALKDVDLEIEAGEFFGLLGPNGAGKSTLIGILGGLVNKDSGSMTVLGKDIIDDYLEVKQMLGIVPQEIAFDNYFNVRETLEIQSGYFGIKENDQRIDEILKALDLKKKEDVGIRELSGGMKRRLLIAKALVHDPEIIVLDEPTAGVDVELRNGLWDYVKKLNAKGKTIILTTHYLAEAEALCDRIAIMNYGEIIKVANKEKLINSIDKKIVNCTFKSSINHNLPDKFDNYEYEIINNNQLKLEVKKSDLDNIITGLEEIAAEISNLEISSAKLEDVFLELTGLGGGSH